MRVEKYKLKTAAASSPLTLAELKRNLHIDTADTSKDNFLQELIDAVVDEVQEDYGRQIISATYTAYLDDFPPDDELEITLGPVSAISSIKYYDTSNVQQTLALNTDYIVDLIEKSARIVFLKSYSVYADRLNAVEIEFVAGWASAGAVPRKIHDALILLASERYLNPENAVLNFGMGLRTTKAETMLRGLRVQRF